jgi:tetratricopeptide (TPR) repeat protein
MLRLLPKTNHWMAIILTFTFETAVQAQQKDGDMLPDFDILWDYGDPKGTEEKFRAILNDVNPSKDFLYSLELKTQIARTLGLQRKFDDAHALLDTIEGPLSEAASRARIRYLLERGRVFNSSGKVDESKPFFLKAIDYAEEAGEENLAVDAVHMMGIVDTPEAGLEWNMKAIAMAEAATEEKARRWLGSLYNNTGWSYHELKEYDKALGLFEKALAYETELGRDKRIRIARWTVGRCYRSLGRIDEALKIQRTLLEEYEFLDGTDGYVLEELGECLLLQGEDEEAKSWFAKAYEELSKDAWLAANDNERLERLKQLGGVE